jgi:NAD(P)-dependent dehydrogenase (short-subunit alcohol dehydrogenase family)
MYGRLVDQPIEEKRKLFDINFWGVVYGCKAAVEHMRARGGTIINVGSEVSDRAVPLLGIYSASKHAVRAYTDTLRMELEHDAIPIWVSLVKPGPIDTPFPQHARKNRCARSPSAAVRACSWRLRRLRRGSPTWSWSGRCGTTCSVMSRPRRATASTGPRARITASGAAGSPGAS